MSALEVDGLQARIGQQEIVKNVSVLVEPRRIVGLIGPNGAGKTTLLRAIEGELPATGGRVRLGGTDLTEEPAFRRARAGLVKTSQVPALFDEMSVFENFLAGAPNHTSERSFAALALRRSIDRHELEQERIALEHMRLLKLTHVANNLAADLSGGQKKLVELGRALMTQPKILLLDEPVAGVHPNLMNDIAVAIRSLAGSGYGFLVIEHRMEFIFDLCDSLYVMADGRIIAEGASGDIRENQMVRDAYLGAM